MGDRRPQKNENDVLSHFQHLNPYTAGIDVGLPSHFVAVPESADEKPVREFSCFTGDLHRLTDWLHACGVKTVAMESIGIYWIPVFEIPECWGFEVKRSMLTISKMTLKYRPEFPERNGSAPS